MTWADAFFYSVCIAVVAVVIVFGLPRLMRFLSETADANGVPRYDETPIWQTTIKYGKPKK